MTDRYIALTVLLDHDIREDDAEPLIAAIRQLRGVMDVQPHVSDISEVWAKEKARRELVEQLMPILFPNWGK